LELFQYQSAAALSGLCKIEAMQEFTSFLLVPSGVLASVQKSLQYVVLVHAASGADAEEA
jgi:hypothetical protein